MASLLFALLARTLGALAGWREHDAPGKILLNPLPRTARFMTLIASLVAVLGLTMPVIAEETPSFRSLVEAAKDARAKGDLDAALNALKAAYQLKPQPVLLNNMGKLHEQRGEYDLAVALYTQVTNDPKATTELRMLDQARLAALEPKLSRAWVQIAPQDRWTDVRVEHTFCPSGGAAEVAITPGERRVELFNKERRESRLLSIELQAGRRTVIEVDALLAERPYSTIILAGLSPVPASVNLDDYILDSPTSQIDRILVPPGQHLTRLMTPDGKWIDIETTSPPGTITSLAQEAGASWVKLNTNVTPSSNAGRSAQGPKLLTAGLGATLVGSGLFLYFDVEEGRNRLLDESQSPNITVRDASYRWESLNTRATVGGVLTGLGSAVVVGSALWWWYDDYTLKTAARLIPLPWCDGEQCGLGVGGEL
jgi:hypothetical protein